MVMYKGVLLAKGSEALALYDTRQFDKLDKHLRMLDLQRRELMERYK
jgi:hypothetical protein